MRITVRIALLVALAAVLMTGCMSLQRNMGEARIRSMMQDLSQLQNSYKVIQLKLVSAKERVSTVDRERALVIDAGIVGANNTFIGRVREYQSGQHKSRLWESVVLMYGQLTERVVSGMRELRKIMMRNQVL